MNTKVVEYWSSRLFGNLILLQLSQSINITLPGIK